MIQEIVIILALILLNGILSMSELAVVSSKQGRLSARARLGSRAAARALQLAKNPTQFLATVQIGITLVGILAGVYGGATLAEEVSVWLVARGWEVTLAETLSMSVVVGLITYLSLVIGELVPKQLALGYAEQISVLVALPLSLLTMICKPLVWFLDRSSTSVMKLLPFNVKGDPEITEDDIRHYVAESAQHGEIELAEKEMTDRVLKLDDRPIKAFMTVRGDVVWLDMTTSLDEMWKVALSVPHSFFPVAEGSLDQVVGFVTMKDLCQAWEAQSIELLRSFIKAPLQVQSSVNALKVLERFEKERRQMALVLDERDSCVGLVTTHDLLEAIVGDLADYEGEASLVVKRADGTWLVDASMDIQELFMSLGVSSPYELDSETYHSVGGYILSRLQDVPKEGEVILADNYRFEIVDMDRHRIDKVIVSKIDRIEG